MTGRENKLEEKSWKRRKEQERTRRGGRLGPATQPWSKSENKIYRRKEKSPEAKDSLINLRKAR